MRKSRSPGTDFTLGIGNALLVQLSRLTQIIIELVRQLRRYGYRPMHLRHRADPWKSKDSELRLEMEMWILINFDERWRTFRV